MPSDELLDWHHLAYRVFSLVLNAFGDFSMMRRVLLGIRDRAESACARSTSTWGLDDHPTGVDRLTILSLRTEPRS
jgi:hypothetical protein